MDRVIFELRTLSVKGPRPTKANLSRHRSSITCTACGETAPARDPRMARTAARIHARTAHGGALADVRSVPVPDA